MKFYKYLYIGDNINNPVKVKWKLKHHAGTSVYVIAVAAGNDQLEIYHSAYLKQKYYRYHPPVIVGIAAGYEEAVQLVVKITQECLDETGGCDIKDYLKTKAANAKQNKGALV